MTRARQALGRAGEDAVDLWLRERGHRIVARNLRTPLGEIDRISLCGFRLFFIEVKTRRDQPALEAWSPHQRHRLQRAASWFLARYQPACEESVLALAAVQMDTAGFTIALREVV